MFPISSSTLTTPGITNFAAVAPTVQTAPVAPVAQVNGSTVTAVGTATDAPAQASVTVDLSPVASFLLTVSQSQQQITQLQAAVANGDDPQDAALRANILNDATQNVVNAFNLLPSVDFDQAQPQGPSLLNNLVQNLTQQTNATQQQSAAQDLARIGVTLQPPLLSDLTGGLSLDNEVLRAAFNTDRDSTTSTLQNTLSTFSELATRFAEQLSAAASAALPALGAYQQPALTPADITANARLDLVRAQLDLVSRIPLPETAADRLAAQRATLEQPANTLTETNSPIVNPLQASTAEVIAAQNAEARQGANSTASTAATARTNEAQSAAPAPANQIAEEAQATDATQANGAAPASDETQDSSGTAQATADAARATAAAQAARQQSTSGLSAATAASAQAAAQANIAQAAAANAAANNPSNATEAQQATAAQTAATNLAAANAAATAASAQAQAAQNAANALSAQNAAALAAVAQARAAQSTATSPEAATAAAAVAAQQASAAQATAANLAAANAAAAQASQQALAAQAAAAQAATLQLDPLRTNPALAAAIAAYNISDPAVLGANARAAQTTTSAIPRVAAVGAATPTGGIGARL